MAIDFIDIYNLEDIKFFLVTIDIKSIVKFSKFGPTKLCQYLGDFISCGLVFLRGKQTETRKKWKITVKQWHEIK